MRSKSSQSYLVVVVSSKVDGDKCKPHDRSGVHGEANVFGLVKVFGYLAGLEGI